MADDFGVDGRSDLACEMGREKLNAAAELDVRGKVNIFWVVETEVMEIRDGGILKGHRLFARAIENNHDSITR